MSKVQPLITLLESIKEGNPLRVSVDPKVLKKWSSKRKGRQKFGDQTR